VTVDSSPWTRTQSCSTMRTLNVHTCDCNFSSVLFVYSLLPAEIHFIPSRRRILHQVILKSSSGLPACYLAGETCWMRDCVSHLFQAMNSCSLHFLSLSLRFLLSFDAPELLNVHLYVTPSTLFHLFATFKSDTLLPFSPLRSSLIVGYTCL